MKMDFKIPNITFSHKMYLKSRVDWPRVNEDLHNLNWSGVYNSSNPVFELNKVITINYNINKMHIVFGHRIDHPFCRWNM